MRLILIVFCSLTLIKALSGSKSDLDQLEDVLKVEKYVAILFTKPCCTCVECVEAEALLSTMNMDLLNEFQIITAKLVDQTELANSYGVKEYPAIVFLRDRKPAIYDGKFEKESLFEWLARGRDIALKELNDESFEHLTQASTGATTGDWLVAFYDETCEDTSLISMLDGAAVRMKNRGNVATVDSAKSPVLKDRFNFKSCQQIMLFRLGKMYKYDLPLKVTNLVSFMEGFYKNAKAQPVPMQKTKFDFLVDASVKFLETNKTGAILSAIGIFMAILLIGWCMTDSNKKGKAE